MIHPRKYRALSALLLAAYAVTSSFSACWHQHGAHVPTAWALAECDHDHSHACEKHLDAGRTAIEGRTAAVRVSAAHSHEDCVVCRFLGQRVLPVAPPATVDHGLLVVELSIVAPGRAFMALIRRTQARAPPSIG
jgi:hypothetical protein